MARRRAAVAAERSKRSRSGARLSHQASYRSVIASRSLALTVGVSPRTRRYSVNFGQLRAARAAYRRAQRYETGQLDPWGRPVDETTVLFVGSWAYAGSGYAASDGYLLALMSADSARAR
jgi:hypothetical protein